ncbi:MAG: DNA mismatch repair protein MutS [Gilvibacter sp.]
MQQIKVGDRVSVIDDDISGVVTSLDTNELSVETEDGFILQFLPSEVVKVDPNVRFHTKGAIDKQVNFLKEQQQQRSRQPGPKKKEKPLAAIPFDLHIEKLTKNHKRMPPFEILELQLDTAKRHIDFAIKNRIPKIVLIHGVGEGVLKTELEYLFKRYNGLSVSPADYRTYGQGATEIYFTQKASLQ